MLVFDINKLKQAKDTKRLLSHLDATSKGKVKALKHRDYISCKLIVEFGQSFIILKIYLIRTLSWKLPLLFILDECETLLLNTGWDIYRFESVPVEYSLNSRLLPQNDLGFNEYLILITGMNSNGNFESSFIINRDLQILLLSFWTSVMQRYPETVLSIDCEAFHHRLWNSTI